MKFVESIPPDSKAEFTTLVLESKATSRASLQGALDVVDGAACTNGLRDSDVQKLLASSLRPPP